VPVTDPVAELGEARIKNKSTASVHDLEKGSFGRKWVLNGGGIGESKV
jgi:hypothetical protein